MSAPQASSQARVLATPDQLRERIRRRSRLKGRQPEDAALDLVRGLLGPRPQDGHRRDLLIEHLHRLQDAEGALREPHLVALAREMNLPMAEVYEVASFYHHFDIVKADAVVPEVRVRVCNGLACELAGAAELHRQLEASLCGTHGASDASGTGGTSATSGTHDVVGAHGTHATRLGKVQVLHAPCIGRCEQAPAVSVNQRAVPFADEAAVRACLDAPDRDRPPTAAVAAEPFDPAALALKSVSPPRDAVQVLPAVTNFARYRAAGGYALPVALAEGRLAVDAVLQVLEDSGLRGLGGAGFPAGRKWRIVREQPAPRLLAINIDEGEPGTFKDRTYLERDPHRFLEGLLVAAQVVGIERCFIYLRDEYHDARGLLAAELAKLQADPPCVLPAIELRRGAGAYICGEESAMIESIEGRRGEPRMRPPYIAQVGLFGRPTLEHNFETLYWVRDIVERGAGWFAGFGRRGRKGLRSFSVSGRVREPGVKLAPAGISLRELVDEYCGGMAEGHELLAYLPGGASGGILPASMADLPLDFDTLQPHGAFIGSAAVMVLSTQDRARDAALNVMRFFREESCGQCTPCRVGTAKAAVLMEADRWDVQTLDDLAEVMADASICGLGQAAPNPIRSIRRHFAGEIE